MPKEESNERYVVGEVPTQTELVVVDSVENKQYSTLQAIVKIMNDVEEIKKSLKG